ncbi:FAD-dependent monooxygenase [Streptomyces sp. AM 2-1-1]|uniref:FAD-dependent monooxygenase n=1 Tax=Streptomyces sp. AM 2-1-1 TaxID=3028709 RepID=UPI0023B9F7D4|nr:FAD-dependent monooxygenase [Streptomyces sp. AM 2-1-1]WEH41366.1 FAD-dependent monooxygenase [Streptomyces sp. AM 2-1-1]
MTTDVLIVGAGPTGLTLACDLARRGIAVRIIDKSAAPPRSSRAKGPNPRSLEVLASLGVADEVLASGAPPLPMRKYRDRLPVSDFDPYADPAPMPATAFDWPRLIAQWRLEEILRDRLAKDGVRVGLGTELVGLDQDGDGAEVTATLSDGRSVAARYVVGCDGAHSPVRKLLGIPFTGETQADQVMVCGDVEIDEDALDRGIWHQWFDATGAVMLCPVPGTRTSWWFQAGPERDGAGVPRPPTEEGFRRLLTRHTGLPGEALRRATLLSTYRVNVRMAERFRDGRVLLAGDSAHVHPIAGGMGMNTGIQDAFNLGWKLAHVLTGLAAPALLDTYEEERLPVAAWTLDFTSERLAETMAAIRRPGGGLDAASAPEASGLSTGYRWSSLAGGTPESGPRAGDRAPDAPCRSAATGAPTWLHHLFAEPHPTLLGFGPESEPILREAAGAHGAAVRVHRVYGPGEAAPAGAAGVVDAEGRIHAAYEPGAAGTVVVVRPDHHLGTVAPASAPERVRAYLALLCGGAQAPLARG